MNKLLRQLTAAIASLVLFSASYGAGLITQSGPRYFPSEPAEALFSDDFDSCDLNGGTGGWDWEASGSASAVTVVSSTLAGTGCAVRFRFGPDAPGEDTSAELRLMSDDPQTEIWVGYKIHIPANYCHREDSIGSSNNKGQLTAWDEGNSATYGSPHVGYEPNFWPVGDCQSKQSVYVWGDNDIGDEHFGPSGYPEYYPEGANVGINTADFGDVIEWTIHYKYATSANNDGVVQVWKRRLTATTLAVEADWLLFIDIDDLNSYSAGQEGFASFYIMGWANSGFLDETDLHLDDFWIATTDLSGASDP